MVGIGSQDNFAYTQEFMQNIGTQTPTMLWDPNFNVWPPFGVTVNSQMILLSADLTTGTAPFFGFDDDTQVQVLEIIAEL